MVTAQYVNVLTDENIVNVILKELKNQGLNVPHSYHDILDSEPFKTESEQEPILYGRKQTPFRKASHYVDGLKVELFRLGDPYEQIAIDISRGSLSADGVETILSQLSPKEIVLHKRLQFEEKRNKETLNVPFIVYHI